MGDDGGRDDPDYDLVYQTISQILAKANDARLRRQDDSRPGNSRDYGNSFAYEHHGAQFLRKDFELKPPSARPYSD